MNNVPIPITIPKATANTINTNSNNIIIILLKCIISFITGDVILVKSSEDSQISLLSPLKAYFFFFEINFFTIHATKNTHTITSPNTMINAAPPIDIVTTIVAISVSNIIVKIVNSIIIIAPFNLFP